jgi:hypothetical protein
MKRELSIPALLSCLLILSAPAQEHCPPERDQRKPHSIEQAVSDRAQLHTIAFDGLAFLTGDFGRDTFLPPGRSPTTSASSICGTSMPGTAGTTPRS